MSVKSSYRYSHSAPPLTAQLSDSVLAVVLGWGVYMFEWKQIQRIFLIGIDNNYSYILNVFC